MLFWEHTLKLEDTKNGESFGFTFEPWNEDIIHIWVVIIMLTRWSWVVSALYKAYSLIVYCWLPWWKEVHT